MTRAATERSRRSWSASSGSLDATMIVMGSMIGSGIFITSAESARLVGSPGWLLVAWALAGAADGHRGPLLRRAGRDDAPGRGPVRLPPRGLRADSFGFLFGWSMFLVVQTGTIAAVAVAFAKFLGVLVAGGRGRPLPRLRRSSWAQATPSASRRSSSSPWR